MRLLQLFVSFVLALAIAVFSVQNTFTVTLKLLWLESVQLPLGVVAIFAVGAGICSAYLGLTAMTAKKT